MSLDTRLQHIAQRRSNAKAAQGTPLVGSLGRVMRANYEGGQSWPDLSKYKNQAETYASSADVYKAVSKIARDGAMVDLNILRLEAEKKIGIVNHELEQLFRHPNDHQSRFDFMEGALTQLLITGNAYWFLDGTPPRGLYVLRSDRVRIAIGRTADQPVAGYVYTVDGIEVPLAESEVIHFALYNPGDDYYGLSPLQAGQRIVRTNSAMTDWNSNYFGKDKAVPAGVVNIKSMIGDADYDRIRAEWRESYGGTRRATAFIRGADVAYQDIGLSHRDMEFVAGMQYTKEDILQIYGLNAALFDKQTTEANALAAIETYTSYTLWPLLNRLAAKITLRLCPLYGDGLICEPTDIRRKDAEAERRQMQAETPFLSINEVRTKFLNIDPYTGDPNADIPTLLLKAAPGGTIFSNSPEGGDVPVEQAMSGKAIDSDGQRKWFFANHPELASSRGMPTFSEGESKAQHIDKFSDFAEGHSNHPVAAHLWDKGMVGYDNQGKVVPNAGAVKNAARNFVQEYRDNSLPKNYHTGPIASERGTSHAQAEVHVDRDKVAEAHAILTAAHVGGIALTEPQHRALTEATKGDYLRRKYSQYASGANGTLMGVSKPRDRSGFVSSNAADLAGYRNEIVQGRKGADLIVDVTAEPVDDWLPRGGETPAMRDELAQFGRWAAKAGRDVNRFHWQATPLDKQLAAKALVDIGALELLTYKAVPTAKDEPRNRTKVYKQIKAALSTYFDGLKQRLIRGVRHVNAPGTGKALPDLNRFKSYFNRDFWDSELLILAGLLGPIIQDAVDRGAIDAAAALRMVSGISYDPAAFNTYAADYAGRYTDLVLKGFNTTTEQGTGAILQRWIAQPDATLGDLIGALQDARLFSGDRAEIVARTEATRAYAVGNYYGGEDLASIANVEPAVTQDQYELLLPAHPNCRCGANPEYTHTEDGSISGLDYRWYTVRIEVCDICTGRDGKLFSDIIAEGL